MLRILILALAIVGAYGQNPCTEEVMRASEIQLFADPTSQTSYLICTDVNTPITMPCSPGTVFSETLRHCIPVGWEAPLCPVGTCFNNADCVIDELNQATCLCRVGFTGVRCEVNIDECALEGNQVCQQAGGVCVDQVNAYYCEWNQGQEIGLTAATRINRPCSLLDLEAGKQFFDLTSPMGNVFLQCTGEFTFLVTKCADMLFWHQELRTCSIERPLEKTGVCRNFPCRNDGTCVDLGSNSFRCECKEGYIGDMCETEIDFCLNRPCRNDGRCVSHPGGYNCVCRDNIVDDSCATGVQNPCGGSNEYLPNNVDSTKYISCALGFGFVKSCAPGLRWDQNTLTCVLIEEVSAPKHNKPSSSYGSYSSAPVVPMNTQQAPVAPSSYGSHSSAPIVPMNTQPAPVAPSSYGSYSSAPQKPRMFPSAPVIPKMTPQQPKYNTVPQPPRTQAPSSYGSSYGTKMLSFFRQ